MPSRNVLKVDTPQTYYHVYARGASRQQIFLDEKDFAVFLNLLKRYLSPEPKQDPRGNNYHHFRGSVELLSYCLMGNHFHFLLYQQEEGAMTELMRCILNSYTRYFNSKYDRSGSLFESTYKASMIISDAYLMHISRYIHLNPKDWRRYPYSSIHSYFKNRNEEWLQPERILELFDNRGAYEQFVSDYEDYKAMLENVKLELADS